jgi:hypothetical protein
MCLYIIVSNYSAIYIYGDFRNLFSVKLRASDLSLWQRTAPIIVGFFMGHVWKDNNKWCN